MIAGQFLVSGLGKRLAGISLLMSVTCCMSVSCNREKPDIQTMLHWQLDGSKIGISAREHGILQPTTPSALVQADPSVLKYLVEDDELVRQLSSKLNKEPVASSVYDEIDKASLYEPCPVMHDSAEQPILKSKKPWNGGFLVIRPSGDTEFMAAMPQKP